MACDGRQLQVTQYQALFALLGSTYGGDNRTVFNLPDLRGTTPIGAGLSRLSGWTVPLAQKAGAETVTLNATNLPQHSHLVNSSNVAGTSANPTDAYPAVIGKPPVATQDPPMVYAPYPTTTQPIPLAPVTLDPAGGGGAHSNIQPTLALMYCICVTQGVWPPRQ